MHTLGLPIALRLLLKAAPQQALLQSHGITTSSTRSSRRARRLRRTGSAGEAEGAKSSVLQSMRAAVNIINNIETLTRNGLTQRVEMPVELLTRLVPIVKRRTHSQLETIRKKYIGDATNERQIPLDSHKKPVGWTLDKSPQLPTFAYGPTETTAFLAYEMEATYACAHHVFRQLQQQHPSFKPASVLDFGSGPGTASWVAKEFYGESLERYRVVEPSQSMMDAAQVLLAGFPGLSVRRNLAEMKRELENGLKYDLIVLNFVLSDITSDFERVAVLSAMWELLSDKGLLVLADRGSPWGSHQVRSARQFILDAVAEEEGERVRILAPCAHHFEVRRCSMEGSLA